MEFYGAVFGYSGYITIYNDSRRHGGIVAMDESWGDSPPNWSVYFNMEDIALQPPKPRNLSE